VKLIRLSVIGLAVSVAASLSAPHVQADILPAVSGRAWFIPGQSEAARLHDLACFSSSNAQVSNSCPDTESPKKFIIPVPIRRIGITTLNVQVNLRFVLIGVPLQCRALVIDGFNNTIGASPLVSAHGGGVQTIPLGTLNVPQGATLQFECDVPGGNSAQVINVNWTQ
jgi:hypothetical protein